MPSVFIPPQMRDLTDGQQEVAVDGATLRDVIEDLGAKFAGIQERVCEEGELAPTLQVSIDSTLTRRMNAPVSEDSEVHFLPAIGGGA